ncbi:hypothetical protein DMENIID0001_137760 [Sergentomyia squamirostris]
MAHKTIYKPSLKMWSGPQLVSPMFHENTTLGRAILFLLNLNPDNVCQISVDDGSQRTNKEIFDATLKIAYNLKKLGCRKEDIFSVICHNIHDLVPVMLAGFFLGIPVNMIDASFPKNEIIHMYRLLNPTMVFCDDYVAKTVKEALNDVGSSARIFVLGRKLPNFSHITDLLDDEGVKSDIMKLYMNPPEVDKSCAAAILCSSGTTGMSKAVQISHESLMIACVHPYMRCIFNSTDTAFSFTSFYWYGGYIYFLLCTFMNIPRLITTQAFSPELWIDIVTKYKVSFAFTSAAQTYQLVNSSLLKKDTMASIKRYSTTGAKLTSELSKAMRQFLYNGYFHNGYGLCESGEIASQTVDSAKESVGYLLPGMQAKIINENGRQMGVGESGELCVKTRKMFMGYYGNEMATREVLDDDGWIHTGDIAHFDEEGSLIFTTRKKEIFKHNGIAVSPAELEQILEKHPDVIQAAVVGVPHPLYVDVPTALVIRRAGSSVTEDELVKFVSSQVMVNKRLHGGVYFVDNLPMTLSGKIRKYKVRELATKFYNLKNSVSATIRSYVYRERIYCEYSSVQGFKGIVRS